MQYKFGSLSVVHLRFTHRDERIFRGVGEVKFYYFPSLSEDLGTDNYLCIFLYLSAFELL